MIWPISHSQQVAKQDFESETLYSTFLGLSLEGFILYLSGSTILTLKSHNFSFKRKKNPPALFGTRELCNNVGLYLTTHR